MNAIIIPFIIIPIAAVMQVEAAMKSLSVPKILQLQNHDHDLLTTADITNTNGNKNDLSDVEELYLEQRLDHFASQPSVPMAKFSQRYFYSSRHVKESDSSDSSDNHNHNDSHHHNNDENFQQKHNLLRKKSNEEKKTSETSPSDKPHSKDTSDSKDTFVFLCVGGEGPSLTKKVLIDSVHCTGDMLELASKMKNEYQASVHLFALEHRYYGQSYPQFSNGSSEVSNSNLVYLSSRQALADIANFVIFAKETYNIGDDVKWITFGGSYPGMMAAWARSKFPHLIHAAVSNSAPVQTVLDYPQYNDVVAYALSDEKVGGSDACAAIVYNGHDEIVSTLSLTNDDDDDNDTNTTEAREKVAKMFNICNGAESLTVERNVESFLGDGVIHIPAQENDPSCKGDLCNIEKICNFLTSSSASSSMEKLAELSKAEFQMKSKSETKSELEQNEECTDIDWEGMISFLSSDAAKVEGTRSWLWQTCTEVGFYQTCHKDSSCPYGRGYHELDRDFEICEKAFGISKELVIQNVNDTLAYYGGWDMEASRILSVNGDVDPWSALSMNSGGKHSNSTDLPTYWSNGASHHFWTHAVKDSDGDGIVATRQMIYNWVINILYPDLDVKNANGDESYSYTSMSRD
jgi:serine protease 16